MKIKEISIYVGNHARVDGIEDFIKIIRDVFAVRGVATKVSSELSPGGINIIVDEFSDLISNERIREFQKIEKNSQFIFLATEFISSIYKVESFNNFQGVIESSWISLFNIYLRTFRQDFDDLRLRDILIFIMLSPAILISIVGFIFGSALRITLQKKNKISSVFIRKLHHLFYMHSRYLGFISNIDCADGLITSHDCIYDQISNSKNIQRNIPKYFGVLYPEINPDAVFGEFMKDKKMLIEITGSVTPYRKSILNKINYCIIAMGKISIELCQEFNFSRGKNYKSNSRGAFSLHPPQTSNWPYCSPLRLYRSLAVDRNMPIITKDFNQHPIEKLCLVAPNFISYLKSFSKENMLFLKSLASNFYDNKNLIKNLEKKIENYNRIAVKNNDSLVNDCMESFAANEY